MYSHVLQELVQQALQQIKIRMAQHAPFMAEQIWLWMQQLAGSDRPADYFLHDEAVPILLFPWWADQLYRGSADSSLQGDLVYSTINGYYYIRLLDNIMDNQQTEDIQLLPALNFFHSQFLRPYQTYFENNHPFWQEFDKIWLRSGEFAMLDASLTKIDSMQFEQLAAQKICAAKIPLAAVCYLHQQSNTLWYELVKSLGCWHQMLNDLFDWQKDLAHGNQSYFLSEAENRKKTDESVTFWMMHSGFSWGCVRISHWMKQLKTVAQQLQIPQLDQYLSHRQELFEKQSAKVRAGLESLDKLSNAFAKAKA